MTQDLKIYMHIIMDKMIYEQNKIILNGQTQNSDNETQGFQAIGYKDECHVYFLTLYPLFA